MRCLDAVTMCTVVLLYIKLVRACYAVTLPPIYPLRIGEYGNYYIRVCE